jgi:hypothetical protein
MNDSMFLQEQEIEEVRPRIIEELMRSVEESQGEERKKKKSGRPQQVPWKQLLLGMLVSILFGMNNYQQLWRRLRSKKIGDYAGISVQDDAIIKRLKNAGSEPFERLLKHLGSQAAVEGTARDLARFAPKIVALDEMTGDQMQRQLKEQRALKKGDKRLLPGKLAGRFNIRSQQWEEVQWREDVQANCKVNMRSLLQGLEEGSLLLFDLGYFAFWWFDELSERGYWWVSRLREKTSYELVHVYWRFEGNLDALIWLGAHRADQAGRLVRLVRFWDGERLHSYISNVLDPQQISMKEIAHLYARRWDIELAFLLIKHYLGLHHWWSSQRELIQQQCLAVIIVAQLLQGMRMQMAIEAGVDAFEISLPLVLQVLPDLLREQQEPVEWIQRYGRELGMIRASSRLEPVVPKIVESDLVMPTEELPKQRKARYHRYGEEGVKSEENVTKSKTGTQKKREKKKEEKERKKKEKGEEGKEQRRGRKGERKGEREKVEASEQRESISEGKVPGEKKKEEKEWASEKRGSKGEVIERKAGVTEMQEREEGAKKEQRKKEKTRKVRKDTISVKKGLPEFSG